MPPDDRRYQRSWQNRGPGGNAGQGRAGDAPRFVAFQLPWTFLRPLPRDTREILLPSGGREQAFYQLGVKTDRDGKPKPQEWDKLLLRFPGASESLNPALFLYRLCPDAETLKERKQLFLSAWKGIANNEPAGFGEALCLRRCALLHDGGVPFLTFTGAVAWRMVVGLGNPNPLETSLTLHPQYGVPLVPGSAVKGLVRHWRLWKIGSEIGVFPLAYDQLQERQKAQKPGPMQSLERLLLMNPTDADERERRDGLLKSLQSDELVLEALQTAPLESPITSLTVKDIEERYAVTFRQVFGATDHQGAVRFHTALPIKWQYDVDVMTPHYGDYYAGKEGVHPADWLEPNPIAFLTLNHKSQFRFDLSGSDSRLVATAFLWLQDAVKDFGVGGRTSAGYGELAVTVKKGA